ncbi:saccharopine dehydrogenase (NADP+, L-glutamate forming) [Saccharicrinis carchari]|uniref:Saccharopine dehydrogenase (NADP+, L-glutamate forming) n=1 Tax=Saccharicrinis carchari TaxID=1168039 RepID=A0A521D4A9_SACCC|nr:saccharopine dehydrogenase C-terminal domain-containing protein [Saccharicrinis carchari]SMO65720.1 saccharopine dehydrogenase (NADP+, L-glutamate forming) [Saccharicrinis carchari]
MSNNKNILILGAGKVAGPIVQYFLRQKYRVTVASQYLYEGELIIENNPLGEAVECCANDGAKLNSLVRNSNVVVSLLPNKFHHLVCKACIRQKRSLLTPSYEQPEISLMHSDACKSNITILNEMGLYPGIDHMWASEIIAEIKARGGKVKKFISACGALPSPESLDNPFRYKFSWSPKAVMRASSAKASYLKNNIMVELEPSQLMKNIVAVKIRRLGKLEAHANRNALPYISLYQIPQVETFFRGTLRYKGWCEVIDALIETGYLSEKPFPEHISNYGDLTAFLGGMENTPNLRDSFARKLNIKTHSNTIMAMEWIGLFSRSHFNTNLSSPFEVLTNRMAGRIKMLPSDKDVVVLNQQILFTLPDGKEKMINAVLTRMGRDDQRTAIADAVSLPTALAAEMLLHKSIEHKGVIRPVYPDIYQPILKKLRENFKFRFKETELDGEKWPKGW